jgi:hypothetical protein
MSISQIIEGTVKNILNIDSDYAKVRLDVCKRCKLLKEDAVFGKMCNKNIYLNPLTDEISSYPKIGFLNGCGCVIKSKIKVLNAKCPLNKW